jgi:amidase
MIVNWSAVELSAAIRRGDVSCVEVMTAYLDQIERLDPSCTAPR